LKYAESIPEEAQDRTPASSAREARGVHIDEASGVFPLTSVARTTLSMTFLSTASAATDISIRSGSAIVQIEKATNELVVVLQDDPQLALLYKRAIVDTGIGRKSWKATSAAFSGAMQSF
jgi:hypothetical protein